MSDNRDERNRASGARSDVPANESGPGRSAMRFDCCGTWMGEGMAQCPCASVIRRHPVITSAVLAIMGLACLLIPAGAILGIIAFFKMI